MNTIIIPLKHIIIDPAKPLDLAAIPEQDAIELIRKSYGFLSSAIQNENTFVEKREIAVILPFRSQSKTFKVIGEFVAVLG